MPYNAGVGNVRGLPVAGTGTTAQRTVAVPYMVWANRDDPANPIWQQWDGAAWVDFNAGAPTLPAWALAGNALAGGEKMGSTNNVDVLFYRNNVEMMHFLAALVEFHRSIQMDANLKITIGSLEMFDDTGGPRLVQSLSGQGLRLRANTTLGSYLHLSAASTTILQAIVSLLVGTRGNPNAGYTLDSDSATRTVFMELGYTDLSVNTKRAVYKSRDIATGVAGVKAPDVYIYAGVNTTDLVRQNVYIAHDGTNPVGKVGVGTNAVSASSFFQIDSITGFFKPPGMTTAQRDAIVAEARDMVYNTTTNKLQCYDGTAWQDCF